MGANCHVHRWRMLLASRQIPMAVTHGPDHKNRSKDGGNQMLTKTPRNGKNGKGISRVTELPKISTTTDTREILAHAAKEARQDNYFIVDVDAHVTETAFWSDVVDRMESDVYKQMARAFKERGGSPGLMNSTPGMLYQDVFGRIPHQQRLGEAVPGGRTHAQVTLVQRAMDSMGIDYMVVFPTPMLVLGMHPQVEMEVVIGNAFNKWLTEVILPQDPRIKAMLYLPFNHPEESLKTVETYANTPGVIGYSVTSTRFRAVKHDSYMPLYSAIQSTGKPLAFHSGFHWGDQSMQQCNRFISMHALSFVHYNLLHMTNWIINGLPERFPRLPVIWIESGLAWVPFLMQRLDSEYMMRSSEAPLLRRRPSEYMREMFYSSPPRGRSNLKLTEATFEAINAETQLLFASDWPHWDFDLPASITNLPFLSAQAKRNILGLNAAKLFNLTVPPPRWPARKPAPARRVPVPA